MGLKHGAYWRKDEARMSNMYLSILRAMGIEERSFADSTGTPSDSNFYPLVNCRVRLAADATARPGASGFEARRVCNSSA
jgi:hypothetical protein